MQQTIRHFFVVAVILTMSLAAPFAFAHGDEEQLLFVAMDGSDASDCTDSAAPCRTIGYAMSRVGKLGQIRVASGTYPVDDAEQLFQLVSGDVDIIGDSSTLTGVPAKFAAHLSERGFHVLADQKGIDIAAAARTDEMLALHASLQSSMPATPCTGGSANGLPCSGVDLLSHFGLADISARPGGSADVWGFVDLNSNREYAIVGFNIGTGIFDVTDPENPREVGFIDGQQTSWRDIKVYQYWDDAAGRFMAFAYVTTDGASDGLFVIDLSGLPHRVRQITYASQFAQAHNVYATNTDFGTGLALGDQLPRLIIAGSSINNGPYRAYTVANPESPVFEVMPGSGRSDYMHDAASMIINDSRKDTQCVNATTYCELLFDFNEGTFDVWDVTSPGSPARLSRTSYANVEYVHSGWWSEDKQYLYVHDELDERNRGLNTTLRVYSLSSLNAPVLAGTWTGPTRAIDHNGFVRGNRYYMSNYTRGLTVLDISDPANPQSVGRLDTYPASDSNSFSGAWGAYPFFHSGTVAISDINSGLYLARDMTLDVPEGQLALSAASYGGAEGTQVQISVSRLGGSQGAVSAAYELVPASANADDLLSTSGTLSWSDGDTADKVITLDLLADAQAENLERMLIRLVAPTGGATLAPQNVASVYVSEAGAAADIGFAEVTIDAAERGFGKAVVIVQRAGSATGAASVDYSMTAGDADPGVDFTGPTSGTLSWADGDADPRWIEFEITNDGVAEADEFIELTLSNAAGAGISQATVRINVADAPNTAPNAVAGASQSVSSGSSVTLDGSQSNDPEGDTLSYQWTQIAGAAVTLNNADAVSTTFTAPTVSSDTLLRFRLTVSDPRGLESTSTTSVTVRRQGGGGGGGGGSVTWLLLFLAIASAATRSPTRTDAA
jgi:choice-of-anchor B domain-containing protein